MIQAPGIWDWSDSLGTLVPADDQAQDWKDAFGDGPGWQAGVTFCLFDKNDGQLSEKPGLLVQSAQADDFWPQSQQEPARAQRPENDHALHPSRAQRRTPAQSAAGHAIFDSTRNKEETNSMKTTHTQCASCGQEREKLYQKNLCRVCLDESFASLRPMIDAFRAMGDRAPANRDLAVSCIET